jgi:hypothetical protein
MRKVAQFWASVVLPTPGAPAIRMPDLPPASRSVSRPYRRIVSVTSTTGRTADLRTVDERAGDRDPHSRSGDSDPQLKAR